MSGEENLAEQQKETPLMWYEYCYGVVDVEE